METNKLYRVTMACKKLGIHRTTVNSAIERGEVETHQTACGLPLVTLAELKRWNKRERKLGRKPNES